ncbi:MAG: WecB/TagA/CpsF family glycosyltransferase [Mesorhizobium sp.]|nr:MAG: WecB/TagA/CpsF family glycosyltransferase [Mesorhizobium sp.]
MNMHTARVAFGVDTLKSILGISVLAIGWDDAVALLTRLIAARRFTKVTFLNAHNANVAHTDPVVAEALDDFLILPDGVGVDLAAKLLHGAPFPDNLNGTDFIPAFLQASARPLTVGLLGATRVNAEAASKKLAALALQHRFVVIHDGYFSPAEEPAIVDRIARLRPDVLLVAMGVPRQELWIARHIDARHCTLPIAVGALLDFLSGTVPRAPLWMRRLRLEWLFRLWIEPGRLWRRYVVGNPLFLWRVVGQKFLRRPAPAKTRPGAGPGADPGASR